MTTVTQPRTTWLRVLAEQSRQLGGRLRPAAERLRPLAVWVQSIRRALLPVTAVGWMTIATGLVMMTLGVRFGWVEAMTVGLACLLLCIVAVVWTLGKSNFAADIEIDATRVRIGDHVLGRVTITNRGRRRLTGTQLELPVGRGLASFRVPAMGATASHEPVFSVPTTRRAVIPIGPVSSVRSDPIGVLRRSQRWSNVVEVFVHPRTVRVDADATGLLRDIEGVTTRDLSSSDVAFHALRDYVPGDDRRAVHWRSTARLGRLIVRQFEETRKTHLLIVLSLNAGDYATEDDFETAVSAASSLVLQAMREERTVTLVTHDGPLHRKVPSLLLDEMCRLEPHIKCNDLPTLTTEAIRQVPDATAAALVTGSGVDASRLRLAHSHLPPNTRTIAIRCDRAEAPSLRRIGAMNVLSIANLDDLPSAIRSSR